VTLVAVPLLYRSVNSIGQFFSAWRRAFIASKGKA